MKKRNREVKFLCINICMQTLGHKKQDQVRLRWMARSSPPLSGSESEWLRRRRPKQRWSASWEIMGSVSDIISADAVDASVASCLIPQLFGTHQPLFARPANGPTATCGTCAALCLLSFSGSAEWTAASAFSLLSALSLDFCAIKGFDRSFRLSSLARNWVIKVARQRVEARPCPRKSRKQENSYSAKWFSERWNKKLQQTILYINISFPLKRK